ncbi:MAG: tyrosine-type recombinase/integrase [Actinomycetota bacterium]|nr:tyrosine-type recombinase/integrase [Actinomycetota bacterium]
MALRVQKVLVPTTGAVSWTVVDECFEPVQPIESYLAHLAAVERSPNTVRAYASSLRLYFDFLAGRQAAWEKVGLDDLGRFVSWLRSPVEGVIPLDAAASARAASTVNRHLAAVFSFYEFCARFGVAVAADLADWRRGDRGSYKPFLEGVGGRSRRGPRRPVRLRTERRLPDTLTTEQVALLLGACEHLRDRLLIALLAESGMRVGQALGLRHSDVISRKKTIRIVPRSDNANGARAKCRDVAEIPVSAPLVRLYSEYLFDEYGDIDSDYVFVNLFAEPVGRPVRYSAMAGLVDRLRTRTGIEFSLHVLRHSAASEWIRAGVPIEVVSKLLTHASIATTSDTYVHLDVEDLRAELVKAGLR